MPGIEILSEISVQDMKDVSLFEPFLLKCEDGLSSKYFNMNKYSKNVIYNSIGIKQKFSNDLFNLDEPIWKSVIDSKISESEDDFTEYKALLFRGNIIDIITDKDLDIKLMIDKFIKNVKEDSSISCFNSFGILNIIFNIGNSVLIASLNFNTGWCSLHSGINHNGTYIMFPRPDIESNSISSFIREFLASFIEISKNASEFAKNDISFLGFNFNEFLSLREVFDVMKSMCCDVSLDEDGYASSISGMSTNNSKILIDFINSFGSTYKSLKKLSFLRKVFKTSNINSESMMKILTEEICSESLNISGYTLAQISNLSSTEEFDKKIIEEEIE